MLQNTVLVVIVTSLAALAIAAIKESFFSYRELLSGDCECGHKRCLHVNGKKECKYAVCKCQIFIFDLDDDDDENGGDNPEPQPIEPEVEELERMFNK